MSWQPPANPDPSDILDSATEDTKHERFADAQDKFVWFHGNALQYRRSLSAVRRSFALSYWLELGNVYPPAMEAFIRTRDLTESKFRQSYDDYDDFSDISAMNRYLELEVRTADLFREAAAAKFESASSYYYVAERSLVAAGYYLDCGPFLEHKERFEFAEMVYRKSLEREESPEFKVPKSAKKRFTYAIATLIALLVVNNREKDAEWVRHQASEALNTAEFLGKMDAAFMGHFPLYEKRSG